MTFPDAPVVLGSRSPRRRELLSLLIGAERVLVRPPRVADEPSFEGIDTRDALTEHLRHIAREKNADVAGQLQTDGTLPAVAGILTADTVIVAADSETVGGKKGACSPSAPMSQI